MHHYIFFEVVHFSTLTLSILRRIFIIFFINYHSPKTLKKSLDEKNTFILCDAIIHFNVHRVPRIGLWKYIYNIPLMFRLFIKYFCNIILLKIYPWFIEFKWLNKFIFPNGILPNIVF